MSKKYDSSTLEDYMQYLKKVRSFDEFQISELCRPILRLIHERNYQAEDFIKASYVEVYESFTGKLYAGRKSTAKKIRAAINYYQCYLQQQGVRKE